MSGRAAYMICRALAGRVALAEAWGARLVVLPDAGHLVAWEQPEALGAGLTAFAEAVTRGE